MVVFCGSVLSSFFWICCCFLGFDFGLGGWLCVAWDTCLCSLKT